MNAPVPLAFSRISGRRRAAAQAVLLAAGACLLAAGCSAGSQPSATMGAAPAAPQRAASRAVPAPGEFGPANGASGAGKTAGLTALPLPGGQSVIFTASLSLRSRNVQGTVARATQLAESAGGYVSGEHASVVQAGRHATPVVSIQFKVPAAAYQPPLARWAPWAPSGRKPSRRRTSPARWPT